MAVDPVCLPVINIFFTASSWESFHPDRTILPSPAFAFRKRGMFLNFSSYSEPPPFPTFLLINNFLAISVVPAKSRRSAPVPVKGNVPWLPVEGRV